MIRPLPPAPSRDDPANFSDRADALMAALPGFVADANLLEQSLQLVGTTGTSSSLVPVGTGAKTLATQPDKAWAVGVWVYVVSASSMGNIMQGQVTAYNVETGSLAVNVVGAAGSGSHSDWIIGLAPAIALAGSIGVTDADGRFAGLNVEAVLTEVARLEGDMIKGAGDATHPSHLVPLSQVQSMIAAAVNSAVPVGSIKPMARMVAPAGWLLIDGKTIGSAASGATARANADTWRLFEQVWAFPAAAVPIFDSAGAAAARGASAAADFAANRRLPLFTPDGGAFLRTWTPTQTADAGRVAGSVQSDAFQGHEHQFFDVQKAAGGGYLGGGDNEWTRNTQQIVQKPGYSAPRVADETRPYNLAMPHYIFMGV